MDKLEIAMPGSSPWMPYAPQAVKYLDHDNDDDALTLQICRSKTQIRPCKHKHREFMTQ
jgi:hypothetical protein